MVLYNDQSFLYKDITVKCYLWRSSVLGTFRELVICKLN